MDTKTRSRREITPEQRQAREAKVDALNAQLQQAVEQLATSEGWRAMLEVSARFPSYSLNNQLLLYVQSLQRGTQLSRVAAFGTWKKLGYRITAGSRSYAIFAPIKTRLRADEVQAWREAGRDPLDSQGRPRMVVRGFRATPVFDLKQVEATAAAVELPGQREWVSQHGHGPAGLWARLVEITTAHGFSLELRPSIGSDGGAHGWTDYLRRIVWVDSDCDEAERVRVLAHEVLGHVRCDHEHREISRAQRETEADSVAYIVLHALGLDISSSTVDYVTGWACHDPDTRARVLREAAETVRRVAVEALAEFETANDETTHASLSDPDRSDG
jgi:hypothetical protein